MPNTDSPMVRVIIGDDKVYSKKQIESVLPFATVKPKKMNSRRTVGRKLGLSGVDLLTRLRLRQSKTLNAFHVHIHDRHYQYAGDDRSEIVFQVANGLAQASFPREQVSDMVQDTVFWIDRESEGKAEDIGRMLDKIFESDEFEHAHASKAKPKPKRKKRDDPEKLQRAATVSRMISRWGYPAETVKLTLSAINKKLFDGSLRTSEITQAVQAATHQQSDGDELFGPPEHQKSLPMDWLWYPYLPKYGLTLLAGDPGRGKSLLIALLIGIITSGQRWPLSDEICPPGRVLLLSAEDSFSRVTLKRLEKTGVNIENLRIMHSPRALTDERLTQLEDFIFAQRPALVVIDTLSFFMGGERDMHRQNEVGEFLGRLNDVAEETGTAILGIGHLNKQTSDNPLNRIVGSIGFAATVRSALFLGLDPADPERLALGHGKASASETGPTIAFERYGGGRDDVPKLVPISEIDADYIEICAPKKREPGRPATQSEAARGHILKLLDKEPKPWAEIRQSLDHWNIASEATFNAVRAEMAKEKLIVQVGKGRKAKWKLSRNKNE